MEELVVLAELNCIGLGLVVEGLWALGIRKLDDKRFQQCYSFELSTYLCYGAVVTVL